MKIKNSERKEFGRSLYEGSLTLGFFDTLYDMQDFDIYGEIHFVYINYAYIFTNFIFSPIYKSYLSKSLIEDRDIRVRKPFEINSEHILICTIFLSLISILSTVQ